MKCPHCLVQFHGSWNVVVFEHDSEGFWHAARTICPACSRLIVRLGALPRPTGTNAMAESPTIENFALVLPKGPARAPLSPEVPGNLREDYREACLVLTDSAKASAALSRRCLQNLLREHAGAKPSDLNREIQQVLEAGKLPSYLANAIDAVRAIGNFAAHPIKSTNSGEVIAVEPGEAEWLLDTLEGLFDFYFVQPATLQKKRDALNTKLDDAGKKRVK